MQLFPQTCLNLHQGLTSCLRSQPPHASSKNALDSPVLLCNRTQLTSTRMLEICGPKMLATARPATRTGWHEAEHMLSE